MRIENRKFDIMVLRSGRDASSRPQAKAVHQEGPNEHSRLWYSCLSSLGPDSEDEEEESQRSSSTLNPDSLAKKAQCSFLFIDRNPRVGNNRTEVSVSLLQRPKSLVSQRPLRSHTGTIRSGGRQAGCIT